jgi:hypothetical protein
MAKNKKASPKVRMTIVAYATVAQLAGVNKGNHMASSPDVAVSDKKNTGLDSQECVGDARTL